MYSMCCVVLYVTVCIGLDGFCSVWYCIVFCIAQYGRSSTVCIVFYGVVRMVLYFVFYVFCSMFCIVLRSILYGRAFVVRYVWYLSYRSHRRAMALLSRSPRAMGSLVTNGRPETWSARDGT